jgi:hypothetical protein
MYAAWNQMLQRCYNENNPGYQYYGARDIKVCAAWHKFTGFLHDVEAGYKDGLSLERINNDGDYCPENCTWISQAEQSGNRRPSSEWNYKIRL